MIDLGIPIPAVRTLAVLVLVPNVLGLGARAFPILFRSLSRWIYPSARIELFAIVGVVLAFAFVFYLFLTARSRSRALQRGPLRDARRGSLPPLEILLLQLGNFSFLVFALIVLLLALGLLFSALRTMVDSPWLARHGLVLGLALALIGMALSLRRPVANARSWETLLASWLSWATLCAIVLAAFGVTAALGGWGPIQIDLAAGEPRPRTLGLLYASLVACLGLARLGTRASGLKAAVGSRRPRLRFVPDLVLAAIATSGLTALYLHGVLLTLRGHLGGL